MRGSTVGLRAELVQWHLTTSLQGSWFQFEFYMCYPWLCGFLRVPWFPPTSLKHADTVGGLAIYDKLLQVCICAYLGTGFTACLTRIKSFLKINKINSLLDINAQSKDQSKTFLLKTLRNLSMS